MPRDLVIQLGTENPKLAKSLTRNRLFDTFDAILKLTSAIDVNDVSLIRTSSLHSFQRTLQSIESRPGYHNFSTTVQSKVDATRLALRTKIPFNFQREAIRARYPLHVRWILIWKTLSFSLSFPFSASFSLVGMTRGTRNLSRSRDCFETSKLESTRWTKP